MLLFRRPWGKINVFKRLVRLGAGAALVLAAAAGASAVQASATLDQSQLQFNTGVWLNRYPVWQSFTAGISGELTEMLLDSNGDIQGGANTVDYSIYLGSGVGGTLLGSGSSTFGNLSSGPFPINWPLAFNLKALGIDVTKGQQYTFDITGVSGSGDLPNRGAIGLAATGITFPGGTISVPGFSNYYTALQFETFVDPIPEPATWAMLIAGLAMVGFAARRRRDDAALAA